MIDEVDIYILSGLIYTAMHRHVKQGRGSLESVGNFVEADCQIVAELIGSQPTGTELATVQQQLLFQSVRRAM